MVNTNARYAARKSWCVDGVRDGKPPDARGGMQMLGTGTRPTVWPRSVRRRCLHIGRDQVDDCSFSLSEISSPVCLQLDGVRPMALKQHRSWFVVTIQRQPTLFRGPFSICILVSGTSGLSGPRPFSTFGVFKQPWFSLSHIVNAPVFVCMPWCLRRTIHGFAHLLSGRNSSKGGACRGGDNGPTVTLLRSKSRPYLSVYRCIKKLFA